jgi:hypothetical protein
MAAYVMWMPPAPVDPRTSLEQLRSTGRDLVALLSGASRERLGREPDTNEWSPATIVGHLADAELVYSVRFRMVLTADRPYLSGFDEEAWVRRLGELEPDAKASMARWRLLREANIRLLESLDDAEWKLSGLHAERGEETMGQLAAALATHDRSHMDQIRRGLSDG